MPDARLLIEQGHINDSTTQLIRESYDRLTDEYARRIFNELRPQPLDQELLDRFASKVATWRGMWHGLGKALPSKATAAFPIAGARQVLKSASEHLGKSESFAIETTLAGKNCL